MITPLTSTYPGTKEIISLKGTKLSSNIHLLTMTHIPHSSTISQATTIYSPSAPSYGYNLMVSFQHVAGFYVDSTNTFPLMSAVTQCMLAEQQLLLKLACLPTSFKPLSGGPQKLSKSIFADIPSFWQPSSSGSLITTTHDCVFTISSCICILFCCYCTCISESLLSVHPYPSHHTPLSKKKYYYYSITSLLEVHVQFMTGCVDDIRAHHFLATLVPYPNS